MLLFGILMVVGSADEGAKGVILPSVRTHTFKNEFVIEIPVG